MPTDADIQAWGATHTWVGYVLVVVALIMAFIVPAFCCGVSSEDEEQDL